MSTDAILLKNDRREILRIFTSFRKAGERAFAAKARLVDRMIELLTVHTYLENEVMYQRVRELLPELEDDAPLIRWYLCERGRPGAGATGRAVADLAVAARRPCEDPGRRGTRVGRVERPDDKPTPPPVV